MGTVKSNVKKQELEVTIDAETRKGRFAEGFGINSKGNLVLLDFVLDTPEKKTIVVSRVILDKETAEALGKMLTSEAGPKNDKNKKEATS